MLLFQATIDKIKQYPGAIPGEWFSKEHLILYNAIDIESEDPLLIYKATTDPDMLYSLLPPGHEGQGL